MGTTAQRCTRKNETYTHIAKPLKTKTVKRCTAKCETSPNCVSWTWNKKKKKCYLIREFDLAERAPWISGNCEGDSSCLGCIGEFCAECAVPCALSVIDSLCIACLGVVCYRKCAKPCGLPPTPIEGGGGGR